MTSGPDAIAGLGTGCLPFHFTVSGEFEAQAPAAKGGCAPETASNGVSGNVGQGSCETDDPGRAPCLPMLVDLAQPAKGDFPHSVPAGTREALGPVVDLFPQRIAFDRLVEVVDGTVNRQGQSAGESADLARA